MVGVCGFVARKKWKNLRHPQGARQGAHRWDLTRRVGGRGQLWKNRFHLSHVFLWTDIEWRGCLPVTQGPFVRQARMIFRLHTGFKFSDDKVLIDCAELALWG